MATDRDTKTLQIPRIRMDTLGITRGTYLVNVALLSETPVLNVVLHPEEVILKVIPSWSYFDP